MYDNLEHNCERDHAQTEISEGDAQRTICMQWHPEQGGFGMYKDVWDRDGDSIGASVVWRFLTWDPEIKLEFPQGASHVTIVRVLRKFLEMMEGSDGHRITLLGLGEQEDNSVWRSPEGQLHFYNPRRDASEREECDLQDEPEVDDEDDEDDEDDFSVGQIT